MKEQGDLGREAESLASLVSSLDLSPERPHVEPQRKAHLPLGPTAEASAFSLPGNLGLSCLGRLGGASELRFA